MRTLHIMSGLIFISLTGCQTSSFTYETPYDNPNYVPPPGTLITLNESIAFSPNNSRSNIQNGKALGHGSYDRFQPRCQFYLYESKDVMKTARSIEPDEFTVIKSSKNVNYVLHQPVDVAAVSVGVGFGGGLYFGNPFDDDNGIQTLTTTMRLRSDKQPQVHELRCSIDDDPRPYNFISINQMIQTLGDVVTMQFPATEAQ